jgi:hypothetical protein
MMDYDSMARDLKEAEDKQVLANFLVMTINDNEYRYISMDGDIFTLDKEQHEKVEQTIRDRTGV